LYLFKISLENDERIASVISKAKDLNFNIAKEQRAIRGYVLLKNDTSRESYAAAKKELEEVTQSLKNLVKDEGQKRLFSTANELSKKISNHNERILSLVDQGKQSTVLDIYRKGEIFKLEREMQGVADAFEKGEEEILKQSKKEEDRALDRVSISLIIGISLTLVLSVIIGLLITNGITKHIAGAINAMSSTSTEIAATVNQHERTASQQASMVNETTTTIQELGASSKQTSEQASSAAEVAQKSLNATGDGTLIVKQTIDGMNILGAKVGMIADQILKLGEQTAQIGNLANMVKDLSVEINMLALNAAVEAARAGEHGKGFAVVAGEIRKLANESKKSAEQANAVIADIQKATNATILRTEEGTKVVDEVTGYVRNVGELFNSLSEAASKVYENAQQVLLNTNQQATAIGQVVEAMNGLNTGARETAAGIVQTKTGIEQLNSATVNLKQIL